jgi:hypothetical protein
MTANNVTSKDFTDLESQIAKARPSMKLCFFFKLVARKESIHHPRGRGRSSGGLESDRITMMVLPSRPM